MLDGYENILENGLSLPQDDAIAREVDVLTRVPVRFSLAWGKSIR